MVFSLQFRNQILFYISLIALTAHFLEFISQLVRKKVSYVLPVFANIFERLESSPRASLGQFMKKKKQDNV